MKGAQEEVKGEEVVSGEEEVSEAATMSAEDQTEPIHVQEEEGEGEGRSLTNIRCKCKKFSIEGNKLFPE